MNLHDPWSPKGLVMTMPHVFSLQQVWRTPLPGSSPWGNYSYSVKSILVHRVTFNDPPKRTMIRSTRLGNLPRPFIKKGDQCPPPSLKHSNSTQTSSIRARVSLLPFQTNSTLNSLALNQLLFVIFFSTWLEPTRVPIGGIHWGTLCKSGAEAWPSSKVLSNQDPIPTGLIHRRSPSSAPSPPKDSLHICSSHPTKLRLKLTLYSQNRSIQPEHLVPSMGTLSRPRSVQQHQITYHLRALQPCWWHHQGATQAVRHSRDDPPRR